LQGTVKWLNSDKGFGYITEEDGVDVFAHFSQINLIGINHLKKGKRFPIMLPNGQKDLKQKISL
jgi:CspA family cold shock protein